MKEPLRAKIEKASKAQGISMNKEIVERLERSFRDQEALYRQFGGRENYNIFRFLAQTPYFAEQMTKQPWREDRRTFRVVMKAIESILEAGIPKEGPDWSEEDLRDSGKEIAQVTYDHVIKSRKKK